MSAPRNDAEISHAQFRALANTIPNLAWMAHPDGWVFWYNKRWYEYTGATPEEMAGWGWQSVHHPEVLPGMLERWTHAIEHGEFFQMIFPLRGADGVYRPFLTRIEPLKEDGVVVGWFGTNTEVTEQERARERLQLVVNELNHRVKNTLATIQSIAVHTMRNPRPESGDIFQLRLMALANVHDILTRENWSSTPLQELVKVAVAHCGIENFDLSGPPTTISPQLASPLAMTLHELCTNAVKYGALSAPGGRVAVSWDVEVTARGPRLRFEWREQGGPPVTAPSKKGFGLRLIELSLAVERDAQVALAFEPTGLICTVSVPLQADVLT